MRELLTFDPAAPKGDYRQSIEYLLKYYDAPETLSVDEVKQSLIKGDHIRIVPREYLYNSMSLNIAADTLKISEFKKQLDDYFETRKVYIEKEQWTNLMIHDTFANNLAIRTAQLEVGIKNAQKHSYSPKAKSLSDNYLNSYYVHNIDTDYYIK